MIWIVFLLFFASCSTIDQLNSNMQNANEIMLENIQTMEASKTAIEENTRQIELSTKTIQEMREGTEHSLTWVALAVGGVIVILLVFALIRKRKK